MILFGPEKEKALLVNWQDFSPNAKDGPERENTDRYKQQINYLSMTHSPARQCKSDADKHMHQEEKDQE